MRETRTESGSPTVQSADIRGREVHIVQVDPEALRKKLAFGNSMVLSAVVVGAPLLVSYDNDGKVLRTSPIFSIIPVDGVGYDVHTMNGSVYQIRGIGPELATREEMPLPDTFIGRISKLLHRADASLPSQGDAGRRHCVSR